ncbi:MAG: GHMP family kinase ATP-binding protein [Eubacteriales bacterium]
MNKRLLELYCKNHNIKSIDIIFTPYRICPIGAHSDHQYGKILGMAIDKGITIAYTPTDNGNIELISLNFPDKIQFNVNNIPPKQNDWADYLRGAVIALDKNIKKRNLVLRRGLFAIIEGTLPIGGLSSSAAVIISFLSALCKVNDIHLSQQELINIALWSENNYVGICVGKLDQSCVVLSKKDHLLYLDTKDNTYELIPTNPEMKPYEIVIIFSGIERTLIGSKFNMRVDELKSTAYALKAFSGMEYGKLSDTRLRDVSREVYETYKNKLPDNWRKRAEHFYTEYERVEKGAEAWRSGDIDTFGQLSFESGYSSIYNYETGSDELKTLYEIMLRTDGIYGGRFSGAGFKGCCVALIDPSFEENIIEKVTIDYLKAFPLLKGKYSTHICHSADGVNF